MSTHTPTERPIERLRCACGALVPTLTRLCTRCGQHADAPPTYTRFWAKVKKTATCWLWTASLDKRGYGQFMDGGHLKRAHRKAWEITYGAIPAGMCVLHRCDNPPCCNPDHLFLGTQADNLADCAAKGRTTRGERSVHATITAATAAEIRQRYAAGGITQAALGACFGVGRGLVQHIVNGNTWAQER